MAERASGRARSRHGGVLAAGQAGRHRIPAESVGAGRGRGCSHASRQERAVVLESHGDLSVTATPIRSGVTVATTEKCQGAAEQ